MKNKINTNPNKKQYFTLTTVLTILLCICISFTAPVIAKWIAESKGESTGRIALFAADAGSTSDTAMILSQSENITAANYSFWIKNSENEKVSEVTTKYNVILNLPESLPEGVTVLVDNEGGAVTNDGKTITFTNENWVFEPGTEESETHTMTFQADFSVVQEDFSADGLEVMVKIEQMD